MRTEDFDYVLPADRIAQCPIEPRDRSRLLVLDRSTGQIAHRQFIDLPLYLAPGDLLVINDSKVIPARLFAIKERSGGKAELFLVEEIRPNEWRALLRPGRRLAPGAQLRLLDAQGAPTEITTTVLEKNREGHGRIVFAGVSDIRSKLEQFGHVPLPPYITRPEQSNGVDDRARYQTVFAREPGSVAAPTAGLHFTPELLARIQARGVAIERITLHVGLGTFAPVAADRIEDHVMHEERFEISAQTAEAIVRTKTASKCVVAVGTTTVRVLESAALSAGSVTASRGRTAIFIFPPFQFRVADRLLTNFHLPRSTLLMLVSAFAASGEIRGRELVLSAYQEAIEQKYRFYSYGDAMFLI